MNAFASAPVVLPGTVVLQAAWEVNGVRREAVTPAGLWPTSPLLVSVLAYDVAHSERGPFRAVVVRLSCRSGPRARALVIGGAVNGEASTSDWLINGWGFPANRAEIEIERRYDGASVVVDRLLEVDLRDPMPLGAHDVQYVVGLHPVVVDGASRLLQVEVDIDHDRLERGRPVLRHFDASRLGDGRLRPTYPVAATVGTGTMTLPKARFLIDPGVEPHLGTSVVG